MFKIHFWSPRLPVLSSQEPVSRELAEKRELFDLSQSGFQSELDRGPLVAVFAGYRHFLGQFQARSST